jgi:hypothetical protein
MKPLPIFLALFGLILAGCESISDATDSIKQKLATRDQPHTRVFAAESRATYEAARLAVDQMDFRFLRGGPAQGELEAISSVDSSESMRGARQIAMTVRLVPAVEEGGTEVRLWLREILEDGSGQNIGQATETPLRDTALYEAFFRDLQQVLVPPKKS